MHTKTPALRRHYGKLEPLERFRLALAAWEREDENEVKALGQSAPTADYRMAAYPYRGMFQSIERVMSVTTAEVLSYAFAMQLSWGLYLGDRGDDPLEHLEEAAMIAQSILATWDGLALFCEELGITVSQARLDPMPQVFDLALEFAHFVLESENRRMMIMIAETCEDMEGEAMEKIRAERAENTAKAGAEMAREYADQLRQVWEMSLGGVG